MNDIKPLSSQYSIISNIGKGAYGDVVKGKKLDDGQIVAMKKVQRIHSKNGFPENAMREIRLLKSLKHHNIINLIDVVTCGSDRDVYMIFDYCSFDLKGLIYKEKRKKLTQEQIRCYMRQMVLSLYICHINLIVHRDIKPDNILIQNNNVVKLADFGLARIFPPIETHHDFVPNEGEPWNVITLYYRPPELLLGENKYRGEVDIWSLGCTLFEMLTNTILFFPKNNTEASQIEAIFEICEYPTSYSWPDFEKLQFYKKIFPNEKQLQRKSNNLKEYLEKKLLDQNDVIDLLLKMLEINPKKRIKAEDAYLHRYLSSLNKKIDPENLPPIHMEEFHSINIEKRFVHNV